MQNKNNLTKSQDHNTHRDNTLNAEQRYTHAKALCKPPIQNKQLEKLFNKHEKNFMTNPFLSQEELFSRVFSQTTYIKGFLAGMDYAIKGNPYALGELKYIVECLNYALKQPLSKQPTKPKTKPTTKPKTKQPIKKLVRGGRNANKK